jgi:uncharacterized membrane protein
MQLWLFSAYAMVGSLFAMTSLNQFLFSSTPNIWLNVVFFALQVLPLLLPLPTMMSGQIRGTFFMCMVSLLYFIHGTLMCFDPDMLLFGALEITFSLSLCASTAAMVRQLREAAGPPPPEPDN